MAKSLYSATSSAKASDQIPQETFVGICRSFSEFARIEPLGTLVTTASGKLLSRSYDLTQFGPSQLVFWPKQDGFPGNYDRYDGLPVQFRIEANLRYSSSESRKFDRFQVAKKGRAWDLDYAGCRILSLDLSKSELIARNKKLTPKVWVRWKNRLCGPWRTREIPGQEAFSLEPEMTKCVYSFPELPKDRYLMADGLEYLLDEPQNEGRQIHDRSTPAQLLNYFLKEALPHLSWEEIREASKDRLRVFFETFSDPEQRELAIERLNKVQEVLEATELSADMIDDLVTSRSFQRLLDQAIKREIESRSTQLEVQARDSVATGLNELEELERLAQEQLAPLRAEREQLESQKAQLERDIEHLRRQAERTQEAQKALQVAKAAFERKRHEVLGEFWALRSLLESPHSISSPSPVTRASAGKGMSRREFLTLTKDAGSGVGQHSMIEAFTYALTCCRWTLVPRLSDVASFSALTDSELLIQQVDPRWLAFEDLFEAEVREFWNAAAADESRLFILALEDLNHSPSFSWAKPILHSINGIQASPRKAIPWPPNLRFVSTISASGFDLGIDLVENFAAITRTAERLPSFSDRFTLSRNAWRVTASGDEIQSLQAVMREDGLSESVAESRALKIRATWPREYTSPGEKPR